MGNQVGDSGSAQDSHRSRTIASFPSDVLVGRCFGALLAILFLVLCRLEARPEKPQGCLLLLLFCGILCVSIPTARYSEVRSTAQ
jgi:hypothetical protein